jgi:hypothetical protein
MTHLILHKVRGEPAFDVAEKLQVGDEEGWIIPTSGHRAYPFMTWSLDDLADTSDINMNGYHPVPWFMSDKLPDDWPDHYECNDSGTALPVGITVMSIIARLMPKMKDRRF